MDRYIEWNKTELEALGITGYEGASAEVDEDGVFETAIYQTEEGFEGQDGWERKKWTRTIKKILEPIAIREAR